MQTELLLHEGFYSEINSNVLGGTMESIEQHIEKDSEILHDPTVSPQMRRHIEDELHDLEEYAEHHKKEIEAGDHHDPTYARNCSVIRTHQNLSV